MRRRRCRAAVVALAALATATLIPAVALAAQGQHPLTAPYPAEACPPCAGWNEPTEPFRIHGGTYYVGSRGLAALLITSPEGHVLIDGGLPDTAPLILAGIEALGFDPSHVRLIVVSHAHFDHAGGVAALQRATGARVAALPAAAEVLEEGQVGPDDPQYGVALDFPVVPGVDRIDDGAPLTVGPLSLTPHRTAGHTSGGTTWTWESCEGGDCLNLVYADSQTPVSADGFRFGDSAAYPSAVADFRRGFAVLESLPCDVLLTPHPGAAGLWERLEAGRSGLVDADACRDYAAAARRQLERRLAEETGGS
ncbi:MAG: subclass B3 metallo-beta-lactamase [Gemmatimonadota bacterium]